MHHRFNFTATTAMHPTRRDLASKLDELKAAALVDKPVVCALPGCPFPTTPDNTGAANHCSVVHAAEAAAAAFIATEPIAPAPTM
jgi:hypothetical protein